MRKSSFEISKKWHSTFFANITLNIDLMCWQGIDLLSITVNPISLDMTLTFAIISHLFCCKEEPSSSMSKLTNLLKLHGYREYQILFQWLLLQIMRCLQARIHKGVRRKWNLVSPKKMFSFVPRWITCTFLILHFNLWNVAYHFLRAPKLAVCN